MEKCSSNTREHHLEFKPEHSQVVLLESPWKRRESHTLQTMRTVLPLPKGKLVGTQQPKLRWAYNHGTPFHWPLETGHFPMCHLYVPNTIYITPANDGT